MLHRLRMLYGLVDGFLRRDLWEVRLEGLTRAQAMGVRLLRVGMITVRGFADDRCGLRASALTFVTLLGVVPLLATMFCVARGFHAEQHLEDYILQSIRSIGEEEVVHWLTDFASQVLKVVKQSRVATLGAVGIAMLLYAVVKMLETIERSFNEIWGVSRARSFLRRIADYISLIVVLSVLLGAPALMTGSLASNVVVRYVSDWIGRNQQAALRAVVFVAPWIGLGFLNTFMPNTKVHWRPALAGAVMGGILWDLSIIGFVKLGIGVGRVNPLFGTFAFLPVALVWLQLNWLIVLLSAEMTYAFQNERSYVLEGAWVQATHATREALALAVVSPIAAHFREGKPPWTPDALAEHLDAPLRLVNEILEVLRSKNIVIAAAGEETAFLPARPLDAIRVAEILDAVGGYAEGSQPAGAIHRGALGVQRRARAASHAAINGLTAADLAELENGNTPTHADD